MMQQARDDPDAVLFKPLDPLFVPAEVELRGAFRSDRLPENGIANGLDPEVRHRVDISQARPMAGLDDLVAEVVANPNQRTFDAAPKLKRFCLWHSYSAATAVSCASSQRCRFSSMRRKVASACPTIWSML